MKENFKEMKMNSTSYKKMVEPYYEEAKAVLKDYVGIDSVLDESTATKEHPFGQGVENALAFVADLGEKLGFKVDRCDNYVTELTYGEGDKILDIYAHSDVVPVNRKNWVHDPFTLVEEDGVFYGRGTNDDKGPGLACLYAVKALMDNGRLGGYKLRFLFGGNEENDSRCLHHYFHEINKGFPTLGFSPDADYPLIYAEKSIYAYRADYSINFDKVLPFKFGAALNIVLDEVEADFTDSEGLIEIVSSYQNDHPEIKMDINVNHLHIKGKPAHGSLPWLGVNAGLHLLNFISYAYGVKEFADIYNQYIDGKGIAINGNYHDEYFADTSYNVGRIYFDGKTMSIFVNLRFPAGMKVNDILANVEKETRAKVTLLSGSEGFVFDPNSDFVKILMNAYQTETGDMESLPEAIGGGTYARESKNSVAFGAAFQGRSMRMHGDDEYFPVSDFFDNMQIYADAIDKLSDYLRTGKKPF